MAEGIILGNNGGGPPNEPTDGEAIPAPTPGPIVVFVTGPMGRAHVDRMATLSRQLCDNQPGTIAGWPMEQSSLAERFQAILNSQVVVLMERWKNDPICRREAQLAVWLERVIYLYTGITTPTGAPALLQLNEEQVQAIIDRGMQVELPEEGRSG
jgi:hypothetical protein